MEIKFTKHALLKIKTVNLMGFRVNNKMVKSILTSPDRVFQRENGIITAQRRLNKNYVLRVVYKIEDKTIKVITLYPGRRKRYEK